MNQIDDILRLIEEEVTKVQSDRIESDPQFRHVDETNEPNDYVAYITSYAGRATQKCHRNEREGPYDYEQMMIKVAGLAVRAIQDHRSRQ